MASVSAIFVYPVKACQGVPLQSATLTREGTLLHDRIFCIVDLNGDRYPAKKSLSMRELPGLASIKVALNDDSTGIILSTDDGGGGNNDESSGFPITISLKDKGVSDLSIECSGASTTSAGSWHLGHLQSRVMSASVTTWLSDHLNRATVDNQKKNKPRATYVLVRATATRSMSRYAGPTQAPYSASVSAQSSGSASPFRMHNVPVKPCDKLKFADMAGLNIASLDSFEDLKGKIRALRGVNEEELSEFSIRSFRPNIVVAGGGPWSEEKWTRFLVRSVNSDRSVSYSSRSVNSSTAMRLLKGCPRCSVPARSWSSGAFQFGPPRRLRFQDALRKAFPEKLVDDEWGVEWQGTMFGIHVGVDWEGEGGAGVVLNVGDEVSVVERKGGYRRLWIFLFVLAGAVVAAAVAVLRSVAN